MPRYSKMYPWGVKTLLQEPFLRKTKVNCRPFQKNDRQPFSDTLSLFVALTVHLYDFEKFEKETSKSFTLFRNNSEEANVSKT